MNRYICIHGHFYQPPRENPWLERIELQDSAYPYHDWNERITAECYGPNAAARILGPDSRIIDIINNYSKMSFNFGPTLLYSMAADKPGVYRSILEADRLSMENFSGHGSAMAQVYNHMIMPLADKRDKYTQVFWGIKDFQARFNRYPEGMWLPETAADTETLETLAGLGIKFTVLAPRQAKRTKKDSKGSKWKDLAGEKIDPTMPYACHLPSGKAIAIFFYDGGIAQELAFGGLLANGEEFAKRLGAAFPQPESQSPSPSEDRPCLVHVATDGESYGHHFKHGDMALSYCLYSIESRDIARLTNYSEYLSKRPPDHLVEIHENSSWSCVHGVERWKSDCGCNTGRPGWNQAWRAPLREAFDWLRDRLAPLFEGEGLKYLRDPWAARNDYIDVVNDRSVENVEGFLRRHASRELTREEKVRALKLLGIQRNAQLMYTSCGWFFDEVSGIETVQVMMYAARAMQLASETAGADLEPEFLSMIEKAPSNVHGNARQAYELFVRPAKVDLLRVGAHYALSSLFQEYDKKTGIFCFDAESAEYEKTEAGKLKLAIGLAKISSRITWEEASICFVVLHLGEQNLTGGVSFFKGPDIYGEMKQDLKSAFEKSDLTGLIRKIDGRFGTDTYTPWHLFRDEQRKVVDQILRLTYQEIESLYRQVFEENYNIMGFIRRLNMPLPRPLSVSAEYVINNDLKKTFNGEIDFEKLSTLIKKAQELSAAIDSETIGYVAGEWVNSMAKSLEGRPEDLNLLEKIRDVLKLLSPLPIKMNLWEAQNVYFSIGRSLYGRLNEKAKAGDEWAGRWAAAFREVGGFVAVKVEQ